MNIHIVLSRTTPFLLCNSMPIHFFPTTSLLILEEEIKCGFAQSRAPITKSYKYKSQLFTDLSHISCNRFLNSQVISLMSSNYFRSIESSISNGLILNTWYKYHPKIKRLDVINVLEKTLIEKVDYSSIVPDFEDRTTFLKKLKELK